MNNKIDDSLLLSKYGIYTSRNRNIINGTSLALAMIGFSNSKLFEHDNYKSYVTMTGVFLLIIVALYGWDNVIDYERFVQDADINRNALLIDENSVTNDINTIKMLLTVLTIIIMIILVKFFYK